MKASPQGARVVPTMPVMTISAPRLCGTCGTTRPAAGLGPVRVRQEGGADVGDEHRREQQQHVLDAMEAAAQDDESDQHRGCRDGEIPADPRELEPCRDARELGAGRAQVRDHERRDHRRRRARAVRGADERDQALSRDEPESRAELVVDDQRRDRQQQDPEQRVAVAGAGDRVGRDPGRVVVREPGEQARAEHRDQCRQPQPSEAPTPSGGRPCRRLSCLTTE